MPLPTALIVCLSLLLAASASADPREHGMSWVGPTPAASMIGRAAVTVRDRRPRDERGPRGHVIGWDLLRDADGATVRRARRIQGEDLDELFLRLGEDTLRAQGVWAWGAIEGWDVRLQLDVERFMCADPEAERPNCAVAVAVSLEWAGAGRERVQTIEWSGSRYRDGGDPWAHLLDTVSVELGELLLDQRVRRQLDVVGDALHAPRVLGESMPVTLATLSTDDGEEVVTWLGRREGGYCVHDDGGPRLVPTEAIRALSLQSATAPGLGTDRWWALAWSGADRRLGVLFARTERGAIVWFPGGTAAFFVPWGDVAIGPVLAATPGGEGCAVPRSRSGPAPVAQRSFERGSEGAPTGFGLGRIVIRQYASVDDERQLEFRVEVLHAGALSEVHVFYNPPAAGWEQVQLREAPDGWFVGQVAVKRGTVYFSVVGEDRGRVDRAGTLERPLQLKRDESDSIAPMR